jgi:hypothetical protein
MTILPVLDGNLFYFFFISLRGVLTYHSSNRCLKFEIDYRTGTVLTNYLDLLLLSAVDCKQEYVEEEESLQTGLPLAADVETNNFVAAGVAPNPVPQNTELSQEVTDNAVKVLLY